MSAASPFLALRLARRELRGGLRGLRVFLACLVLGVAAIAGIGSLTAAVVAGITGNARELLGGDVEARLAYRPAGPAERAFLARSGTLSEIAALRAMARTGNGNRRSLIELKAVDRAYPLFGALVLSPPQPLDRALARMDGKFGAVVDPALLARLGVAIGDEVEIGRAVIEVRGTIAHEPDALAGGLTFGPRVIISAAALIETGIVQPGALVNYHYRLRLPAGTGPTRWIAAARAAFPQAGWQLRSFAEATPSLRRLVDRVGLYLSLIGLTALLVGGVGVGNAVAFYIAAKTPTIAALKCLGASTRLVFAVYFVEIVGIATVAIMIGLAVGALAPIVAAPFFANLLPVSAGLAIHPRPLAAAAAYGLLTTLVFSLGPLAAIGRVPAGALFRDRVERATRRPSLLVLGATAVLALTLAAFVLAFASDHSVTLWFLAGTIVAFALFRAAGALFVLGAGKLGQPRRPMLRLAVANLHRPGAPTGQIMLSLGLGLTVLITVALVEGNLAHEIGDRLPATAPAYFFIDIQSNELPGFEEIVRATPRARFEEVPMMRGRITRLNGVPVDAATVEPDARWALDSDRGITYAASLPPGSRLAAGEWWPRDYHGPPLVSFDAALARGMGLRIGDTLTVNLLGREITARIANLRAIDWQRLGINFVMVFAPGILEHAPQTHLAVVYLPAGGNELLVRRVTERFPNVSAIDVREALAAVDRIVGMIGRAVQLTALVTLGAGVLVLGGAVAAGHRRRVYDAVVLKVLGATRAAIASAFLIEHGLLGFFCVLAAGVFGTLAAYLLVTRSLGLDWVFLPVPLLWTAAAAMVLTLGLGFAGAWRALGAKAAPYLRNE